MIAPTSRDRPGGESAPAGVGQFARSLLRRVLVPILLALILISGQAGPAGAQKATPDAETVLTEARAWCLRSFGQAPSGSIRIEKSRRSCWA